MRCVTVLLFVLGVLTAAAQDTTPIQASPSPAAPSPLKPATYSQAHVDQPYVAMTFDDGPSAANTPRLLDMLKQRNIKATFFLIGQNVAANPDIVRRILAEGHEIGNHTWTHPQLSKLGDDRVTTEITKTQEAIKEASGFTPTLLRPPYGAITPRQREWIENQFGLSVILWSVDPLDWKRPGPSVVTQRILSQARPGAIILSHDIHKQTVDAMPATLDGLIAKGYKFATVSQLIAMNKPKPATGQTANIERSRNSKAMLPAPASSATPALPAPQHPENTAPANSSVPAPAAR
jgi:peptidoglycan-N-acetylglucosamine deacetylase